MQKWVDGPVFNDPVAVTAANSNVLEGDPSVDPGGNALYFQRGYDIQVITRADAAAPWSAPVPVNDFNTGSTETKVTFAPSMLRAYVASNRPGTVGGMDLWRYRRDVVTDPWVVQAAFLTNLNTAGDEHDPHMSGDQLRMYLAINSNNAQTIAVGSRADTMSVFSAPVTIAEIDGAGAEADPTLTEDDRLLVFMSTSSGKRRLMYSMRPTAAAPFSTPVELSTLNSDIGGGDFDPSISGDGCTLYWSSTRTGTGDIYVTTLREGVPPT